MGTTPLKFGENFRRYDVSDPQLLLYQPGRLLGLRIDKPSSSFATGEAYQYRKAFIPLQRSFRSLSGVWVPMRRMNGRATHNLKLTLALRFEHNSNPGLPDQLLLEPERGVCKLASCSGRKRLPDSPVALSMFPYSADLHYGQHQAYPGVDALVVSPRVGFQLGSDGYWQNGNQRRPWTVLRQSGGWLG